MRQILISMISLFISFSAHALEAEFAFGGGVKSTSIDAKTAGVNSEGRTGYQIGAYAFFPFTEQFQLRSGFLYSQRAFNGSFSGNDYDVKLGYVDIPVTAMYKFSEFGGVYAGPVISFLQGKDYNRSVISNAKSTEVPFTIGVNFKFAPQIGADVFYEVVSGSVVDGFENMRSFGGSLIIYFE